MSVDAANRGLKSSVGVLFQAPMEGVHLLWTLYDVPEPELVHQLMNLCSSHGSPLQALRILKDLKQKKSIINEASLQLIVFSSPGLDQLGQYGPVLELDQSALQHFCITSKGWCMQLIF